MNRSAREASPSGDVRETALSPRSRCVRHPPGPLRRTSTRTYGARTRKLPAPDRGSRVMAVVSRPCFDLARFGIIVVVAAEINLATPRDGAISFGHEMPFPGRQAGRISRRWPPGTPNHVRLSVPQRRNRLETGLVIAIQRSKISKAIALAARRLRLHHDRTVPGAGRFLGPDGSWDQTVPGRQSDDPGW